MGHVGGVSAPYLVQTLLPALPAPSLSSASPPGSLLQDDSKFIHPALPVSLSSWLECQLPLHVLDLRDLKPKFQFPCPGPHLFLLQQPFAQKMAFSPSSPLPWLSHAPPPIQAHQPVLLILPPTRSLDLAPSLHFHWFLPSPSHWNIKQPPLSFLSSILAPSTTFSTLYSKGAFTNVTSPD